LDISLEEAIFNSIIGDIYVLEGVTYGSLYTNEYLSQLDSIVMVSIDMTLSGEDTKATFKLVTAENRPVLKAK